MEGRGRDLFFLGELRLESIPSSLRISLCWLRPGAAVFDLGFESASPEILGLMKKAEHPAEYLSKAKAVLAAAKDAGLIIKLNILFYAGDRRSTLLETFDFLSENEELIHSISAYPLLVCPGTGLAESIEPTLKAHGGAICFESEWGGTACLSGSQQC